MKIPNLKIARSTVLLVVGILGIAYETIFQKVHDPVLLVGFFAMCGLPLFLPGGVLNSVAIPPATTAVEVVSPGARESEGNNA